MRYGVLGPVEVDVENEVVAIGGPQQRRMLALLLQRPGSGGVDRPHGRLPVGRRRGPRRCGALRHDLCVTPAVGARRGRDRARARRLPARPRRLDAGRRRVRGLPRRRPRSAEPGRAMELYDQALALWRGDAYGELGAGVVAARRGQSAERDAAGRRWRSGPRSMVALGQHQRAIPELNWMRSSHPLRERPVALLMQALFAAGRQADALREYQAYRAALGDETGLEPSADLQALERSIAVGQAPTPAGGAAALAARATPFTQCIGEGAFGRGAGGDAAGHEPRGRDQGDPSRPRRRQPRSCSGSRPRPNSSPGSSIRTSCRSTTTGASPAAPTSCSACSPAARRRRALVSGGAFDVGAGEPARRGGRLGAAGGAHGRRRPLRRQAVERPVRRGRQLVPDRLRHRLDVEHR